MRLLNTETFQLQEFFGRPNEPYTILSHTWAHEEVTFQQFQSVQDATSKRETSRVNAISTHSGYRKIQDCCKRSREDGFCWTWIDTCCIDKTNSVELSESINSMFQWYKNAAVCYVLLDDVEKTPNAEVDLLSALQMSRWFTRGWTLQELIAPARLLMFGRSWQFLGELLEGSALMDTISQTTGIPSSYLHKDSIYSASISMRMSWAARREVTRAEDMAYCLLGIFNVNMPLLYGEGGDRASVRLQEEIIKINHDQTIFAWEAVPTSGLTMHDSEDIGILATSPGAFRRSGKLVPSVPDANSMPNAFEMTHLGLSICLPFWQGRKDGEFLGLLGCHEADEPGKRIALRFSSSHTILRHAGSSTSLSTQILIMLREAWSFKTHEENIELSAISELYRDYKRGPIEDGATMYRQSGPLLFEDVVPLPDEPWYSCATEAINTMLFLSELRPRSAPSSVIISQPQTFQPRITQVRFIFPRGFTFEILEGSDPALRKTTTSPGHGFSLVITDHEAQNTKRKDLFIFLWKQADDLGSVLSSNPNTVGLIASFHWTPGQQSYRLLMTSGPRKRHLTSMRHNLYEYRRREGRAKIPYRGKQYSSLISNYGPQSIRVEIKGRPIQSAAFRLYSPIFAGYVLIVLSSILPYCVLAVFFLLVPTTDWSLKQANGCASVPILNINYILMALTNSIVLPNGCKYEQPTGLFINNEFLPASGDEFAVYNPTEGEEVIKLKGASAEDVDKAVAAARQAFEGDWSKLAAVERGAFLFKLAELIHRDRELLAAIDAFDNGKTYAAALAADIDESYNVFKYYGGAADKISGSTIETSPKKLAYVLQEPLGVCGHIIPWKFPFMMLAWKQTPLSALYFGNLVIEAGLPAGVVNIVCGLGSVTDNAIASHLDVDKVAFTGSTMTRRAIMKAASSNLKNITLECGGKSPAIVFEDADIEKAVKWTHVGIMDNKGEVCTSTSRIYVHKTMYDKFLNRSVEVTKETDKLGSPFEDETIQGPQIFRVQYEKILSYIEEGKKEGAQLAYGGSGRNEGKGYFLQPTVFTNVTETMKIVPVVVIAKFSATEEVVRKANDTCFGLAAALFTENVTKAHIVARKLQAGMVWMSSSGNSHFGIPFGSYKSSGIGRELGKYALDAYT
ncbi:hypothetical protein G7054_g11128 [Neopestalotiopsis clavispora]|nr:hypothetical protein G7054_g11128 [Neopestalotiopsis clavispora]